MESLKLLDLFAGDGVIAADFLPQAALLAKARDPALRQAEQNGGLGCGDV